MTRKLGAGGMGAVYHATDTHLGREVALKVLLPQYASDPERIARFQREARAASALNHPNIVTIYDAGVTETVPWIAMELLAGETLRKAPPSSETLLDVSVQLAEAISRAHEAGIVHRDLKPDNIMLTPSGLVKVLDFGIARVRVSGSDATATLSMTTEGAVVGTPGYMSPEQVAARPIDHRSDQFAFGTILYELATGINPFRRDTAAQTMAAILEATPDPPRARNSSIDPGFSSVIERCLAKDPGERYATTSELLADLRAVRAGTLKAPARRIHVPAKLAIAAALLLIAAATAAFLFLKPGAIEEQPPVLAVRTFRNISTDPAQEYFSAGITEEIQGQISKIASIRLLSRSAVERYKDGDLRRLAAETGAKLVVEGTVRSDKDRVRVTVQLVDTSTEQTVWSQQYDGKVEDIFRVQSDVAVQIAGAMQAQLTPEERKRIDDRPTRSVAAYDLFLRARRINRYASNETAKAVSLFKQAIDIDPQFAEAMAEIAERLTYVPAAGNEVEALKWGERAVRAKPDSSVAHFAFGMALANTGMTSKARLELTRSLELEPNNNRAMSVLGSILHQLGNYEESLHWQRRALERSPNGAAYFVHVSAPLSSLEDKTALERWYQVAHSRYPKSYRVALMGVTLEGIFGDTQKALTTTRQLLAANPNNIELLALTADLAMLNHAADAEELCRKTNGDMLDPQFINAMIFTESPRTRYAYFSQKNGTALVRNAF
ncbi:MAG: protein kinase [Bryobacteraceae bacterium]|nr:protein kinase [Bryobacteraceae bacterium]